MTRPLSERFWEKVKTNGACWLWQGSKSGSIGYGQIRGPSGRPEFAHRVSWQLANGPIPDRAYVLHRCDVPACVRPDHLYLGSALNNSQDAAASNRLRRAAKYLEGNNGMADVISVRLPASTIQAIDAISARDGLTRSDVIRRSLDALR